DKVVYETDENNNIIAEYTYDAQGNPATIIKNGVTYYYHVNGHGDVMALTDESGNVVAEYNYDAYGNIVSQSGSMASANPLRYSGYRYDEATGLYYLMARYYDANVGRFITRDTFHGFEDEPRSLNQYAYTNNNPVMFVDPSGHAPSLRIFVDLHNAVLEMTRSLLKLKGKITVTQIATYSSRSSVIPNGFMDIYSPSTREVWEVKRDNKRGISAGINQLNKYTSSFVKKYNFDKPILGTQAFSGYIYLSEGIYDITAHCSGALVLYDYRVNTTRAALAGVVVVGGVLIFAATGLPVPGWVAAFA
ncbi:MAG: hypothetical protein N2749_00495, partial [Clostridia bacterium]|nr:hypothetical protein [Clostridia bacterium]